MDVITYAAAKAYTDKSMKEATGMVEKVLGDVALPVVTSADNGKMLQVVDGAWSTVSITDGNEVAY